MDEPIVTYPVPSKRIKDITGKRFGRLVVIGYTGKVANGEAAWLCQCDCGQQTITSGCYLRSGHTTSCGCAKIDVSRSQGTHNMSKTRIYAIWSYMIARCTNESNPRYADYGGRGIAVCDRWLSFESFYADMGPRPSPKHSLDRIDVDGPYSPENTRWATSYTQANNTRRNRYITFGDETLTRSQWAKKVGISRQLLFHRLETLKWPIERALTEPVGAYRDTSKTKP